MFSRAVAMLLMLVPVLARAGELPRANSRAPSRSECRPLAYRAYLVCLATEKRLATSGIAVPATTCTAVMESMKRECRGETVGGRVPEVVAKIGSAVPQSARAEQAPTSDAPDAAPRLQ